MGFVYGRGSDERKLYLAIEATSEVAISKAKAEITRLIKDELVRLVSILKWGLCVWGWGSSTCTWVRIVSLMKGSLCVSGRMM